ncbi:MULTISPECIES: dihydrolipoamide acetyltransferase family protein [Streptomyces]|uniref:Dihydrolipoamide acetyltransferase component of pyruvate dehydrogenase complex n=1 Tax=Streptomyces doudnae TaxID=3075536 RepID=A0ABD5EHX9_9ACTN|nr:MULTISPECIES: dihydrolipoamide acetyltransferase family protein [unclassified Streptomyces]MDT0433649.1 dihydrolipoamide acetyltransferase family protein [Streptomyces sp. DSM 41981]MYQ68381.1 2-oxo acid dehydrogenase subunit E2 [Streptomyces sp. SID4950]SCE45668.1 pyruvate dehydrogenase E2 component (dihydrolipoamide acetyltransferase) [Streptomyces sp. SolWspMP-5a-2]
MAETADRLREFRMPDVGEGLTEAEILTWYVGPGDTVTDGQTVCEIETAKAVVELPIPFDGVVRELRCAAGQTVPVGAVVITVAEPSAAPGGQPVLVGYGVAPERAGRRPRATPLRPAPGTALAKPPVRKLARDLGVDLTTLRPASPDGVVTRAEVEAAAARHTTPPPGPTEPPVPPKPDDPRDVRDTRGSSDAGDADDARDRRDHRDARDPRDHWDARDPRDRQDARDPRETRVPVRGVRRATAAAVTASAFTAPHVTEFVTVDVTRTTRLVRALGRAPEFADRRVGPLLLVAKALLTAVARHPDINASWDEAAQEIVRKDYVNLGVATATPRGLLVPNVKDAHALPLTALADALTELVTTARAGRTSPAALTGGTLTLTNIGVFGVDTGTPILPPGEAAILAVGAIGTRPWVHKKKVTPRQVLTLALTFDHRLIDGELGAKVLADVASVLERPQRLIARG